MERNMKSKEGTTPRASEALKREAAVWFELIHSDEPSTEALAQWQRWMAEPEHRQAFRQVEDLWRAAGHIKNPPWATLAEMQADEYEGVQSVAKWNAQAEARAPKQRLWTLAAGVGAIAAGVTLYFMYFANAGLPGAATQSVQTAAIEHRDVTLPDGTRVTLGARSAISVAFTDSERGVRVERGEVFFNVASDKSWPFVVRAGERTITAIGTAFNVVQQGDRFEVTVAEGVVDVVELAPSPRGADRAAAQVPARKERLKAGQRLSSERGASAIETVNIEEALTWIAGRRTYLNEPLRNVIPDIARYTNRTLVISDPAIEQMLYTGTVMQGGVDDWLTGLGHAFPEIEILQAGDNQTILRLKASGVGPDTAVQ
jgi:transmembrane sensor